MPNGNAVPAEERLLRPCEVAARFKVTTTTVTRYANSGKLASIRTPGGQRRFREAEVNSFFAAADEAAQ